MKSSFPNASSDSPLIAALDGETVHLFAQAAPGLEEVLRREVAALPGVVEATEVPGGVTFAGPPALIGAANLWLRSAGRVLLRLASFHARRMPQLVDAAAAVPWERYLAPGTWPGVGPGAVEVKATCHASRIYHSDAAAERIGLGIQARLTERRAPPPRADAPAALAFLRGIDDHWELSLDTSGELLHRRGYRVEQGPAPLRESLAAALLLLAGYEGGPLCDLCCGSGTIAIEAALIRRRIAPGLSRDFAFTTWPTFDAARFAAQRDDARARILPAGAQEIFALDIDPRVVDIARNNAERAGVGEIAFHPTDLFAAAPGAVLPSGLDLPKMLLVANPPYGKRLSERGPAGEPGTFWHRLGDHLRERFRGARALVLAGSRSSIEQIGLRGPVLSLQNGGLPISVGYGLVGFLPPRFADGRRPRQREPQKDRFAYRKGREGAEPHRPRPGPPQKQ